MKMKIRYLQTIILYLTFASWPNFLYADDETSVAERTALQYMTAFFSIKMDEVIAITHPDTIDQMHQGFLSEMSYAEDNKELKRFLAQFGISSGAKELRKMPKKELYSLVVSSNNRRAPKEALKQMKTTEFKVLRSKIVDPQTTIVTLAMGNSQPSKEVSLELRLYNEEWLVVGNAP